MRAIVVVIGTGWIVFWAGWLLAALTAKSSRGRSGPLLGARILIGAAIFWLLREQWHGHGPSVTSSPVLAGIGLAQWAAGLALAVWARLCIGRNWGMPMTQREHPDLVTTGPYRFIRHPIYTGLLLALVGSALAISLWGLIAVAVIGAFFVYSAVREEGFLTREFPDGYPVYRARSKMLIPFLL